MHQMKKLTETDKQRNYVYTRNDKFNNFCCNNKIVKQKKKISVISNVQLYYLFF